MDILSIVFGRFWSYDKTENAVGNSNIFFFFFFLNYLDTIFQFDGFNNLKYSGSKWFWYWGKDTIKKYMIGRKV